MVHSRPALTLFAEEKESHVRWGKFDPLSFTMALLDIDTALVWMYFWPQDMVARKKLSSP